MRRLGRTVPREVVWGGAQHDFDRRQAPDQKRAVLERSNPDSHVNPFGHQVDEAITVQELDAQARINRKEVR
jgi:hypothetical protein